MLAYFFLGIIQGIFEWIPVSSEGVVALASNFLIQEVNPVDVALFLHIGTLFAVLVYFRKDWKEVLTFKNPELLRFLIIATFISLIIGYPLYKIVRDTMVGSGLLLVTGLGLLATAYFNKQRKAYGVGFKKLAIIVGFLQGLAVIPGLSRSGSTIFGLSLGKATPSEILKISYMMSVPVVMISSTYLFLGNPVLLFEGWAALISSFFVGLLSLHFLINLAAKINFFKFAVIFSIVCFLGAAIGFMI